MGCGISKEDRAGNTAGHTPAPGKKDFEHLSKRIYRILGLSGYARVDYRMTENGRIYVLEVNPNPQIARQEDFADSAEHCGVRYKALLQKIMTLGMRYDPMR
ncbi:MAG: hypothetical protein ACREAB_02975 [Blastocatellia bacterium]